MPKKHLSIRKNSRSNKNKNKILKKSKKMVKNFKVKGKAKKNKRVVKSKHLQRKHNKKEKKIKYTKKKKGLIGGGNFGNEDSGNEYSGNGNNGNESENNNSESENPHQPTSNSRVSVGGIKLAKLQLLFDKLPSVSTMRTRSGIDHAAVYMNRINSNINNSGIEIGSRQLKTIAKDISEGWKGIINGIRDEILSDNEFPDFYDPSEIVSINFPYIDSNNMSDEFSEEYFVTIMRDYATKLWDKSTSYSNMNSGGGAVNTLAEIYNDFGEDLRQMFVDNWRGGPVRTIKRNKNRTMLPAQVFDYSYNYNHTRDRDRYCYISSRCNEDVRSLEHLFAFFDGLFVGVLVSDYLMKVAKEYLVEEDYEAYQKLVLLLHPLASAGPNERKSNQGLLHVVYTPSPEGGPVQDDDPEFINKTIQFELLPKEYFTEKRFGRTGTACWWGLMDNYRNFNNGGWYGRERTKEVSVNNVRTNQNSFIQTVINTANQLLNEHNNLVNFLISWQSHMAYEFSYDETDLQDELAALKKYGTGDIDRICVEYDNGQKDCEDYIQSVMESVEDYQPIDNSNNENNENNENNGS